jgi:hypothetical protein
MRIQEIISEKLVHAMPLKDRPPTDNRFRKATPLVPAVVPPPDPGTAIAMALPQIAQAVAGGSQMAAQQAISIDDAEEQQQQASLAAQQYQQNTKPK